MSAEDVLQKARDRGFQMTAMSGDKTWYSFITEKSPICLHLYPHTDEFEIIYAQGLFQLRSGKCGSFSSDKHFKRFANEAHKLAMKLKS